MLHSVDIKVKETQLQLSRYESLVRIQTSPKAIIRQNMVCWGPVPETEEEECWRGGKARQVF